MRFLVFLCCLISFLLRVQASTESKREWLNKLEALRSIIQQNDYLTSKAGQVRHDTKTTGSLDFGVDLQCTPEPTTVHRLRPQDFAVIGAMGDSITAANGATAVALPGVAIEDRGISWSIGGDGSLEDTLTLTNILREFNPNLMGYSLGSGISADNWFNVAVPGHRAYHMPGQANELIKRMKEDESINFELDWKLVTMFIGGNDLCALDRDYGRASPHAYRDYIEEALDILHQGLPRAFINIVDILEIYLLPNVSSGFGASPGCSAAQGIACSYVVNANAAEQQYIIEQNRLYQVLVQELIDSGKYDTRDNFTVVVQPFLRDTVLPFTEDGQVDATYFAPDCFHFSAKGHAMGALNIWNNMLEPIGQKSTVWSIDDLKCPTKEAPYFYTRLNSGIEGSGDQPTTPHPTTTTTIASTTTTKATTTTASPITTTTTQKPVECQPQQCTENTPDWVIAAVTILSAALLVQTIVLFVGLCSSSSSKKSRLNSFSSTASSRSSTKL